MIEFDRLVNAAYHAERVASRKLAARLHIPEPDALAQVLGAHAGEAGLEQLLASRERERAAETARRSGRVAARAAAQRARLSARQADPQRWNAWFDGSARPNPGPCAIGALLTGPGGELVEISRAAGYGTSSEAEYLALLAVLEAALQAGATGLVVRGDSRVVIDDMLGDARSAAPSLLALRQEALRLSAQIGVELAWIPRHRNQRADQLAQQGHR